LKQIEIGEIERRVRNGKIQRAIIEAVAATGVLAVAAVMPNAVQMFPKLFGYGVPKMRSSSLRRAQRRLIERRLLSSDGSRLRLTSEGERLLTILRISGKQQKRPRRWDHKWRLVIFDIPESLKRVRNRLRQELSSYGFMKLQDSVWIYPYPCEGLISLLKADFRIGKSLLYIVADEVEGDMWLRKGFKIK